MRHIDDMQFNAYYLQRITDTSTCEAKQSRILLMIISYYHLMTTYWPTEAWSVYNSWRFCHTSGVSIIREFCTVLRTDIFLLVALNSKTL